jgi:hypothetical protein
MCGEFGDDAFWRGFIPAKTQAILRLHQDALPTCHLLDTGITGDLSRRVFEHGTQLFPALPAGTTWRD